MRRGVLKEGIIYGFGGALARFTGVFVTPIYTRFLNTDEFGLLDFGTTSIAILMIITELQLNSGFLRHYIDFQKAKLLYSMIGAIFFTFLVLSSLVFISIYFYSGYFDQDVFGLSWKYFQPITLILFPNLIIQLFLAKLRMEHKPKQFIYFSIGQTWLMAILGLLSVIYINASALTILWSMLLTKVLFFIPILGMLYRQGISFDRLSLIKPLLKYSIPIVPNVLSNWLNRYISRFFILSTLSVSALGIYGLSTKVAALFLILITGFRMAWNPYAMSLFHMKNSESQFVKIYYLYFFIAFSAMMALTALSWPLVLVFGGVNYLASVLLIPFILGGLFWDGALNILAIGNNWTKKTYKNIIGSLSASSLNFIILWFFTKDYGLVVVAGSFMLCSQLQCYITYIVAQKSKWLPYRPLLVIITFILFDLFVFGVYLINLNYRPSLIVVGLHTLWGLMFVGLTYQFLLSKELKNILSDLIKSNVKQVVQ